MIQHTIIIMFILDIQALALFIALIICKMYNKSRTIHLRCTCCGRIKWNPNIHEDFLD